MISVTSKQESRLAVKQSQNYNGIDLIKFLCAIMVFTIHTAPFQGEVFGFAKCFNFGLQHYLCRLAVPFYFVSSGFFLFKKMSPGELNTETIKSYCFKLLRLFGTWCAVLLVSGMYHLWYLGATVIAVVLVSVCVHRGIKFRYICLIAGLLYLVGLFGDAYHGVIAPLTEISFFKYLWKGYSFAFSTTRNGLFMGFAFVLMGAAFAWHKINIKPFAALIGLTGSLLCLLAEVFLLKSNDFPIDYNMYIFLLPATFFLFAFACGVRLKDRSVYKHLRNVGVLIYFSHKLIKRFVSLAVLGVKKFIGVDTSQYLFVITLFFTLLITIFVEWLSYKKKFKWLNYFMS